ncbi:hypothetical protein MJO28_010270 [Puccinia striiformis f. sp. tritici]|uniref:Uncharacterized protein n=1 Tax=Puccinia striiformis f. sp. tritici TaxID=168172 RepID=A0ACC0E672_9BASI|nr:hypothetical protein MJO28_010270 [Puccinia striiformis f. sp. tritici]
MRLFDYCKLFVIAVVQIHAVSAEFKCGDPRTTKRTTPLCTRNITPADRRRARGPDIRPTDTALLLNPLKVGKSFTCHGLKIIRAPAERSLCCEGVAWHRLASTDQGFIDETCTYVAD